MTSRNKTLTSMHIEFNKKINLGGCSVGITDGSDL
jgi:hypothetical protein